MVSKIAPPVNLKVNDKWYNIGRFMGEKTQENSVTGYSAAYPTGAERITELILREIRKYKKKGVRR